jgi:hypothetical protein
MSASQENACLKRMTPFPDATDAAIRAFAGIPALPKAPAIEGASVTIMEQLGHFPMSEKPNPLRRYIAPVPGPIYKQGEQV